MTHLMLAMVAAMVCVLAAVHAADYAWCSRGQTYQFVAGKYAAIALACAAVTGPSGVLAVYWTARAIMEARP